MLRLAPFLVSTVIQCLESVAAAPCLEARAACVCGSGILRELVPYLRRYALVRALCNAVFPVKYTTEAFKQAVTDTKTTIKSAAATTPRTDVGTDMQGTKRCANTACPDEA